MNHFKRKSPKNNDRWITLENGSRVLLDDDGNIKGGLGGKHTGKSLGQAFGSGESDSASDSETTSTERGNTQKAGHETWREKYGSDATEESIAEAMSKEFSEGLGREVSPSEANEMWESTLAYSGSAYGDIRAAYNDPDNASAESLKQLQQVDDFIAGSPKFDGPTYRGINVDSATLASFTPGAEIDMQGPSSWSSDQTQASTFLRGEGSQVMFELPETRKSASITHVSNHPGEREVLAPSSARYVVESITEKKTGYRRHRVSTYTIRLREVE